MDGSPAFLPVTGGGRGRSRSGGVPALVFLLVVLAAILLISLLA